MKVSLIIPIAKFGFFVEVCLQNVQETCGLSLDEFDFVFLSFTVVLFIVSMMCSRYAQRVQKGLTET